MWALLWYSSFAAFALMKLIVPELLGYQMWKSPLS